MWSRRQFLLGVGASALAAAVPVACSSTLGVSRRRLALWGDGGPVVRIGHLSDLHFSTSIPLRHIRRAIDLLIAERPDVICATGDFVTRRAPDPAAYVDELARLSAAAPTFACLGNHDGGAWMARRGGPKTPDEVIDVLRAAHIAVLRDGTTEFAARGRALLLSGVSDLWSHPIEARKLSSGRRPHVVLAHNPDTKDELDAAPWDLMLSGHTHGGQVRLPYFGGTLTAPVRDSRYIEGLLPWRDRHLHVSRGVGCLWGIRVNCPPEVTVLELA